VDGRRTTTDASAATSASPAQSPATDASGLHGTVISTRVSGQVASDRLSSDRRVSAVLAYLRG
jgi:hypothetical protein